MFKPLLFSLLLAVGCRETPDLAPNSTTTTSTGADMTAELNSRMQMALEASQAKMKAGLKDAGISFALRRRDIGSLHLPTGRLCVTDAYEAQSFSPLNCLVPPGDYKAQLVVAEIPQTALFGGTRNAFLCITFSMQAVKSWQAVTAVKSDYPCFTDEAPHKFVQEGGTGLFSPEAGNIHYQLLKSKFEERVSWVEAQTQHSGADAWINYCPGPDQANMIIVNGGFGDSEAACFLGLDSSGRATHLIIDYGFAVPVK